ncbi:hypothetical protein I540_5949 [Mycobacteroides abscessus subsp. bolletii 1513]|uniref:Uncharacterized protein n=1 Tax=Mycobacteroides abscessus subsp. bolletii 1513 TaxID=1299321 RepID=X8DFP1_9MYCO|nr:hypothetical protein I540_5949 [Mycobacteroides abscessus subsp. bolletii 1513]
MTARRKAVQTLFRGRQIQLTLTASRAIESGRPEPLFVDSFAERLVLGSDDPYALALLETAGHIRPPTPRPGARFSSPAAGPS